MLSLFSVGTIALCARVHQSLFISHHSLFIALSLASESSPDLPYLEFPCRRQACLQSWDCNNAAQDQVAAFVFSQAALKRLLRRLLSGSSTMHKSTPVAFSLKKQCALSCRKRCVTSLEKSKVRVPLSLAVFANERIRDRCAGF